MDLHVARRHLEAEWQRLLAAREAIEAEGLSVQTEDDSVGELSPIDQHQADAASEVFEREKDFSVRDQIDHDLQAVEDAFRRIDLDHYGRCETCGIDIPDERLAAVPTTRFCVEHERLWELRTISLSTPAVPFTDGAASAELVALHEASQHFEFLPTDDDIEPESDMPVEETAVHLELADADE